MKPKKQESSACDDLFRLRLEQLLDQRYVLYRLAGKIDWNPVEDRFGGLYAEAGRPGIPIRLMVGLHYLKHAFNESDEAVVGDHPGKVRPILTPKQALLEITWRHAGADAADQGAQNPFLFWYLSLD